MASPWIVPTPQRRPAERPWMGLAMLLLIPLLSLILIRMLWSDSTLWFLMVGIILLGAGAVTFLSRRSGDPYAQPGAMPQSNRLPLALAGLGALLLALLVLPNVSSSSSTPALESQQRSAPPGATSQVSGLSQAPARPTAVAQHTQQSQPTAQPQSTQASSSLTQAQAENSPPAGSQVYTVVDGDTLWDIAQQHNTTVESIVAANNLQDENDLHLGQELTIPPAQ